MVTSHMWLLPGFFPLSLRPTRKKNTYKNLRDAKQQRAVKLHSVHGTVVNPHTLTLHVNTIIYRSSKSAPCELGHDLYSNIQQEVLSTECSCFTSQEGSR